MAQPIFIIGAGRSGTNLLSETFTAEDERFLNTYENRYIWNYGQRSLKLDLRSPGEATLKVGSYIRAHFDRLSDGGRRRVIDKTPGNALRIPFILAIYEDARFVHIIRDGRDNVLSRVRQWEPRREGDSGSDVLPEFIAGCWGLVASRISHIVSMRRVGNLPAGRWPVFVADNAWSFVSQLASGRPRRWGERIPGLTDAVKAYGIDIAAAIQWREVTMAAAVEGRKLEPERYLEIRYEEFISNPGAVWSRVLDFLGETPTGRGEKYLAEKVRPLNSRKWVGTADSQLVSRLESHIRPTLEFLGYPW